jgi:hypothetical protein
MTRQTTHLPQRYFAVMALSCICAAAAPVKAASPIGMEGGITAYQFDGVYKGNSQGVATNDDSCRPGQQVAIDVRYGRFKLFWNDRQSFDAQIARDGSFFATSGVSPGLAEKRMSIIPTLQGHVGATGLVADYGTRWCRYRLEASQPVLPQRLSQRVDAAGTRQ